MLARRSLLVALVVLPHLGCSTSTADDDASTGGGSGHAGAGAGATVVPGDLVLSAVEGGTGVLEVVALTLEQGSSGLELYAALRNDGDAPACDAALSVELFDRSEQSVTAGISAVLTKRFYRIADDAGNLTSCAAPGDVAMAALLDLPTDVPLTEIGYLRYRTPYFAVAVTPIDGLAVVQATSVARADGTAYTGTLHNGLDVAVSNPSVMVFPLTLAGRPLGVATARATLDVPPGGSWSFETDSVDTPGVDFAAFPSAALAH